MLDQPVTYVTIILEVPVSNIGGNTDWDASWFSSMFPDMLG
jgi:hypothetical protein